MSLKDHLISIVQTKNFDSSDKISLIKTIKGLSPKELCEVGWELMPELQEHYKEYPVDINTFIHDPYYMGNVYGKALYPIWGKLLSDLYPGSLMTKYDEVILSCATRSGKCHGIDTEIILHNGHLKKVQHIVKGDVLMGVGGAPRKVLSTCSGRDKMYAIHPVQGGDPWTCNSAHVLSLTCVKGVASYSKGSIYNMSVLDFLKLPVKVQQSLMLYRGSFDLPKKDTTLPPYVYGMWLGTGVVRRLALVTADPKISNVWEQYGKKYLRCSVNHLPNYTTEKNNSYKQMVGGPLKIYKMYLSRSTTVDYKKRILSDYLHNCKEVRLQVLAGLIDNVGRVSEDKRKITFKLKNSELYDDVLFLARSLGFCATMICETPDKPLVEIQGKLTQLPTQVINSKLLKNTPSSDFMDFEVQALGEGNYYGFELDGDNLYLIKDCTVTHNTVCCSLSALYELYRLMCMKDPASFYTNIGSNKLAFGLIAYSEDQVKRGLVGYIMQGLKLSPFFLDNLPFNLAESSMTKGGMPVTDSISIIAGSDVRKIIGSSIFFSAVDEINIRPPNIREVDFIENKLYLYREALDRKKSSLANAPAMAGLTWMMSSPTSENDVINNRIEEVLAQDIKRVRICDNVSRWVAQNADIDPKFDYFLGSDTKDPRPLIEETDFDYIGITKDSKEYKEFINSEKIITIPYTDSKGDNNYLKEFKNQPIKSIRDIAGRRTSADSNFFKSVSVFEDIFCKPQTLFNKDIITVNFNTSNKFDLDNYLIDKSYFMSPDRPECYRYIHLDIAYKTDMFGLCSVYSDILKFTSEDNREMRKRFYFVDFCLGVVASEGCHVDILQVLKFLFELKNIGYPIKKITTDSQQGELSRQIIQTNGITAEYLSVDRTKDPYLNLKNVITEKLLEGYINPPLVKDLRNLKEYENKICKPSGKGHTDDLSNALAGAVYACTMDRGGFRKTDDIINQIMGYSGVVDLSQFGYV